MLPWLEMQLAKLVTMRQEFGSRQQELVDLLKQSRTNGASGKKEEQVANTQKRIETLAEELQQGWREITQSGILLRDLDRGLVDFPSYREGREVYLCWLRGEEKIGYWHDTSVGFSDRQPL